MYIYTARDNIEDMLCCIYTAWERALTCGHNNICLMKEPVIQNTLFDEYIHVDYSEEQYEKVVRSIKRKISDNAFFHIYYALLSYEEDSLDAVYRFLIKAFKIGADIMYQYNIPEVARILELRRNVGNEAHYFREFARFNSIDNRLYICHLEPKNNITEIVANHFADRMPSENWMIIDDNRKTAVVHAADCENYIRILSDDEMEKLKKTELVSDEYTDMWRAFFDAIAIKERTNYRCQRNMMPLWMRKHATEFM
ncbi:MAG: TIGR03915 family putative DNA repair protein [Lachnospiraceae bacterium]|nr:TIGR03915 family putative DNA repair protein [Lachnospiraceae bacterium]MEE0958609.1 TIGR03915 family putative DNA repair protein [Lachnospiraceae bacterium]